ncbi:MAG: hypothetical protein AAF828_11550 [Bacteroidota bacterium]
MNPFYTQLPKMTQWLIGLLLFGVAMVVASFWGVYSFETPWFYLGIFILAPIFQFASTPFFTLTGSFKYLSPMLLVFSASQEKYDLHLGTSFDYLLVMRGVPPGPQFRRQILIYLLDVLLGVIDMVETGEIPGRVEVRGCSYFFTESTAKRLGFTTKTISWPERLNILINGIDLTWQYSLAQGRLTFPALWKAQTATTSGAQLVEQKESLTNLLAYLKKGRTAA